MASKYYTGSAATSVAMVDRFTPATVQVGDIFTLTATGEDGSTAAISFTAAATTVSSVTAGLVAAWNASTNPLHTPITAADATTSMTLTADTAGVPFSVAATTTDGGGANTQTLTRASVTVNVGPNDWGTALNWSDFTVPVSTDTVTLDGRAEAAILYGLNQSAVTLASFQHYESMRYDVGTSTAPLRISATICDTTRPAVDGSRNTPGALYLNLGTNQTTFTNYGGAPNGSGGLPPVCVKGAHASNVARVNGGSVGIAVQKPGDTANFPTVTAYNAQTKVVIGSGASTVDPLTVRDADVVTYASSGTVDQEGGSLRTEGSGVVSAWNCNGDAVINSSGTISSLTIEDAGAVDTTQTAAPRTIGNCEVAGDGTLKSDLNTAFTNGVNLRRGANSSQVDFPDDVNLAFSAAP